MDLDVATLTIRDDRGQRLPLYLPKPSVLPGAAPEEIPAAEFEPIRAWINRRAGCLHVFRIVALGGGLACMAGLVLMALLSRTRPTWSGTSWWLITIVPYLIALLTWKRTFPTRSKRVIRAAMLEHGRCASCGYSLLGFSAQADGCHVCPECGAAWRLPS